MKTIALLAINAKFVHSSLAAWTLSAAVSRYAKTPFRIGVAEAAINQSDDEILAQILECVPGFLPDVIGISTYIWNASILARLIPLIRSELPKAILVLGGPEAGNNPAGWLAEDGHRADFVIRGEGERSFPALLDALAATSDASTLPALAIPGVCLRRYDGTIALSEPEPLLPEDFVDPLSDEYLASLDKRIAYLETSRGCPYKCSFCLSGSEATGVRFLPVEMAKERLRRLAKTKARTIKLVDRTFNCQPSRARELLEFVIGLDTPCCFHFEVAPDLFDRGALELLKTAPKGRIQMEAGIQSFHEPTLLAVSRRTDSRKAAENIREIVYNGNIHLHIDLIAGLPHETLAVFQDSFNQAYALGAHTLQPGFLKLLHGSRIREEASEFGIAFGQEPPYEVTSTLWLAEEDLGVIKKAASAIQRTYNKGRFLSFLRYVLGASKLDPFSLYRELGEAGQGYATPLGVYAEEIYNRAKEMPGVDASIALELIICDWLSMLKGKDLPPFMRITGKQKKSYAAYAEKFLGYPLERNEVALLPSGRGAFVDGNKKDPVTGLYEAYVIVSENPFEVIPRGGYGC